MGRGNRKKTRREVKKRRLDTAASDAFGDAYQANKAEESKKRRSNGKIPSSLITTDLKLDKNSQTWCTGEDDIDDWTCPDGRSKPDYATVVKKGFKDHSNAIQTRFPNATTAGNDQGYVTIYTVRCRSVSFLCLKCSSDDSDACNGTTPTIFFQHEEIIVTATPMKDSYASDGLPVCRAFDNSFVKENTKLFEPYWKNILKYVTDDKHIIDLHGLTRSVASAASEYAVARESKYAKDLKGNGCSKYKKLEIITGCGNHSKGPRILHDAVQNHLKTLGYEKVKQSAVNQGLLEVDVRNAKPDDMTLLYCSMYSRRAN